MITAHFISLVGSNAPGWLCFKANYSAMAESENGFILVKKLLCDLKQIQKICCFDKTTILAFHRPCVDAWPQTVFLVWLYCSALDKIGTMTYIIYIYPSKQNYCLIRPFRNINLFKIFSTITKLTQ